MDPRTGEIHKFKDDRVFRRFVKKAGNPLIHLTEKEAAELEKIPPSERMKHISKRRIRFLLKGKPCPCRSGKSFKKCCWKKYKKR
jgi:hypothetical protein